MRIMLSIEDIILGNDMRGVAALRRHLPERYCEEAARFALSDLGTTLIATGFYISKAGAPEADGPPGALALGRALESLGQRVVYVSDCYTAPILLPFVKDEAQVVDFPIADDDVSRQFASDLLSRLKASLLISIERCGLTEHGTYLNMRGLDISLQTARLDHLFLQHPRTIGIGDGGNEIGMGNLAQFIPTVPTLPANPAMTRTTHLVISSTSNWGAYGLLAALSRLTGRDLLPNEDEEAALIRRMVDLGAVDGVLGVSQYSVDGMDVKEHGEALRLLRNLVADERIPSQSAPDPRISNR